MANISKSRTGWLALLALAGCAQAPSPGPDAQRLLAAMRREPIVLLGEVHDNAAIHAQRAQALRELLAAGARPALLMEQFDREQQSRLDEILASANASVDALIAVSGSDSPSMAGWDWTLYRPYLALVVQYKLTLVAANVSRADTRRVLQRGLTELGFIDQVPPDIVAAQAQAILDGHCGLLEPQQAEHLVAAQVARDQFMARSIERYADRGVVLLAGNGHVRRDVGVPRWLGPSARSHSVSIGLVEHGDPGAESFDVVFSAAPQPRVDPCESLRRTPAPARNAAITRIAP